MPAQYRLQLSIQFSNSSTIPSFNSYASAVCSSCDMAMSRSQSTRTIRGRLPIPCAICRNRDHKRWWSGVALLRRYTSFWLGSSFSLELSALSSRCV